MKLILIIPYSSLLN